MPEPMLARSGNLPAGDGWAFEPKLDGFRALACTHRGLRVRSRRGWNMTRLLPELEALPAGLQLDAELVAPDAEGRPDFHRLCRRMLHGDQSIPVRLYAFDLVALDGEPTVRLPYLERRLRLEALELRGPHWETVPRFADGELLYRAMCQQGLEGVVAKRLCDPYRPGERRWLKRKNPANARVQQEQEAVMRIVTRSASGPHQDGVGHYRPHVELPGRESEQP